MTDRFALHEHARLFDPAGEACDRAAPRFATRAWRTIRMNIFADFQARVVAALIEKRMAAAGSLPEDLDLARFVVEPPRDAAHGDLSTNAAMV